MTNRQLHEIIDIRHAETMEEQAIRTPGRKGIFGFGKTEDKVKKVLTGRKTRLMHDELVNGGNGEPAVIVAYKATAFKWVPTVTSTDNWKTAVEGRGGQTLEMVLVVPESLAQEFEREIDADPIFMRDVAERIMKDKILAKPQAWDGPTKITDKTMATPSKPPYEKWDREEGGRRIYVQREGDPKGWNEDSVRKINKV